MLARTLLFFSLWFASCSAVAPRSPSAAVVVQGEDPFPALTEIAESGRQLNFGAGLRSFEDEAFGRLDDQVALMLDYCEPMGFEALRLEGGLHYSYDEADGNSGGQAVRLKGQSFELSAGLNASKLFGRVRPYLGLGGSLLFVNLRGIDEDVDLIFDDDDVTVGGYAKAGILLQVSRTSHVGVEFRHFEGGDVTLDGTELGTGYEQFVLVFGTSFR
jgi:hypothetical protein